MAKAMTAMTRAFPFRILGNWLFLVVSSCLLEKSRNNKPRPGGQGFLVEMAGLAPASRRTTNWYGFHAHSAVVERHHVDNGRETVMTVFRQYRLLGLNGLPVGPAI